MNFLQPLLLAGLPLVALPILIHLINRQRHRTKRWAAMMFLFSAKRMSRGMARLRQILIMAMRMLAIAALIFAIARPLASGWLGLAAGGRPATVLILLDRSPSMESQDLQTGASKRSTGLNKLVKLVSTLGATTRVVLIESAAEAPREIESPQTLLELPEVAPTAASADVPGMLQLATEYMQENQTGRTDVWICSDLRRHDWDPQSTRWDGFRQAVGQLQGVRFHLLAYEDPADGNVAVRVRRVLRRQLADGAELVFDVDLHRHGGAPPKVPVGLVINGARSVLDIEMADEEFHLQGHVVPLDSETTSGWGRVELPSDSNPQDNVFYFAFGPQPERRTVIVAEDSQSAEALRLAVSTPVDAAVDHSAEVLNPAQADQIDWDNAALIVWQAPLPDGAVAQLLEQFHERGRSILFFPPSDPVGNELFGARWGDWRDAQQGAPVVVAGWREDSGLLVNTQSGSALPVGELKTYRYCALEHDNTVLARFDSGDPLLAQADTSSGSVHFCSTLPRTSHSTLARDGVVFYVMLQRALQSGAESLDRVKHVSAGADVGVDPSTWEPLPTGQPPVLSTARSYHSGVYSTGEDQLIAVNRSAAEDELATLNPSDVDDLFAGLDYYVVNDQLGSVRELASEIWRGFLIAMAIALVAEAVLCMPSRTPPPQIVLGET